MRGEGPGLPLLSFLPSGGARMTEDQWNDYLSRSKTLWVRIDDELLHSKAYRDLTYAPAIKVLNWFHEKIRRKVDKKRRGIKRYIILNNGEFEFTYREAGFRGLTAQQYRKALKELYELGFIEIKKPGSALKGDFTVFTLSDRWKAYKTPDDRRSDFPRSSLWRNFGFGSNEKRKKKLDVKIHSQSNVKIHS